MRSSDEKLTHKYLIPCLGTGHQVLVHGNWSQSQERLERSFSPNLWEGQYPWHAGKEVGLISLKSVGRNRPLHSLVKWYVWQLPKVSLFLIDLIRESLCSSLPPMADQCSLKSPIMCFGKKETSKWKFNCTQQYMLCSETLQGTAR